MSTMTIEKTVEERISEAKARIACQRPFWGVIALMCRYVAASWIGALAATDCVKHIYYDPERMAFLPDAEMTGVLVHEYLHVVFMHNLRRGSKKMEKWNRACDYAINPMVIGMGYKLPQGVLLDQKYSGKSAEEIYDLLPDEPEVLLDILLPAPIGGEGGFPSEDAAAEYVKDLISKAYSIHKGGSFQGSLPGGVEEYIKKLLTPQVPWQRVFHRYAGETLTKNDFTLFPPNRRYLPFEVVAPSMRSYEVGRLVISVDDSGSITSGQLQAFASETAKLASLVEEATIIVSDSVIQQVIKTHEILAFLKEIKFKGRGGTNHIPVFGHIEKERLVPELFIGLTDGHSTFPVKKPRFPVLWCLTAQGALPPWGGSVYINV